MPVRDRFLNDDIAPEKDATFEESVRQELSRILRSAVFANAPSLRRFLSYIVESTLQNSPAPLNEYSLGVDVFDRGESFDPSTDTIVRVQTRRLRSKIEKYYACEGQADPLVIEVPRGGYRALFQAASAGDRGATPHLAHDSLSPPNRLEGSRLVRAGLPPPVPLPAACTSFVGREKELSRVKELLCSEHVRLLTLSGAGGSGKTRLALRAAAEVNRDFPGGVYLAPLASVTDPGTVASTVRIPRTRSGRPGSVTNPVTAVRRCRILGSAAAVRASTQSKVDRLVIIRGMPSSPGRAARSRTVGGI